jgi:thiamine biosynthesis lipoprotein
VLYGPDRPLLQEAADAAFEEARRLDRLLSNYLPASEWSGMNRDAGAAAGRRVVVSRELFDVLSACEQYSRRSRGAFDISVGPLMKVWGFYKGEGRLPRPDEVTQAMQRVGYRRVRLDRSARTIRFTRAGMELDPGGIGKGYAVDRMIGVLKAHGVAIALVSAAGSSVYGLGAPPDDPSGWRMTIGLPGQPNQSAAVVHLKNMSLSTSGSEEKFFWADGRRYAHIMDPRTGYPAQGVSAVSVLAPRTIDSEAWTKAYFVNGRRWAASNRPDDFRVFFCDDRRPPGCGWID